MYEKFYNLKTEPFHITPDVRFLYLSETHREALASTIYVAQKRQGFMTITGGAGVGKTAILRAFVQKAANAALKVVYVLGTNVTFTDIVAAIYRELDLEPTTTDPVEMMDGLHSALVRLREQGRTMVLIIDEAQTMSIETLENLCTLSNLETSTEKLIQVVLVGQPELEELLESQELRRLKQRITVRSKIAPLNRVESRAYVAHRLSVAGVENPAVFKKKALNRIIAGAEGVPRLLNVLCNNALIAGFQRGENPVTKSIAREIVTAFGGKKAQPFLQRWRATAMSIVGVVFRMPLHVTRPEPVRSSSEHLHKL